VTAVDSAVESGRHPYNRMRRRRITALVIVVFVIIAVVGAVLLTLVIKSPAQQAAETKAPAVTQLTAPVVRTVLSTTVLGQAVVEPPPEVSPSNIGSSAGGSASENVQKIVTKIFHGTGSYIGEGQVILEVAGRPFFALAGSVPAYRNLVPGETGQDVVQLQDDLEALGYGVGGDTSGVYGAGTSAAVTAFYDAIGYSVPKITTGPKADRGATVPLGEYTFVPRMPARIVSLDAKVGAAVKSLTLAEGRPSIAGQLSPSNAREVRPGMRVTITVPGTGATVPGRVVSVSHQTATKASISGGLYVAMRVRTRRPLPLSLVGQDVSMTIAAARTPGPVLAVPEAAIFAGADGQTYVSKMVGGHPVRVAVRVGMAGTGLVQVTPTKPGALAPGDSVLTGQNYVGSSPVGRAFTGNTGRGGKRSFQIVGPVGGGGG
jgi:peptidoglycan hydrolase-like protein with peptidoglycan-binding domain